MSIESLSPRVGPPIAPDASQAPPAAPQGAADRILAPLDHLHDQLAGGLATLGRSAETTVARRSTVLGAIAQFLVGAAGAFGTMAEGMWQMARHPLRTLEGLWALATHVPLTPMWLWRLVTDGPRQTLAEDRAFLGAVVQGFLAPYKADWRAGRYFAVAGRAAVDIGTLYVGIKQAKTAVDRWRANRAARTAEESLATQLMGSETRASGQVMGEGTVVIDRDLVVRVEHPWAKKPHVSGEDMIQHVRTRGQASGAVPNVRATRSAMKKAAGRFPGNKPELRAKAIAQLERDQKLFAQLRQVGPKRLAEEGLVQRRFRTLTASVDTRMDAEIRALLDLEPYGLPKQPGRAAAKLELLQAKDGGKIRLGHLDDAARGRIDLPRFDPGKMRDILKTIRRHFGDDNLLIKDYIRGKPFYRGRLHIKIRDGSGLWYELQLGPKQLSAFYDTPFQAAGKATNVHDAVYKGLLQLDEPALKVLGKGDAALGSRRVAAVLDTYVDEVTEVMEVAKAGKSYVFEPQTSALRRGISDLLDELPADRLPPGLR